MNKLGFRPCGFTLYSVVYKIGSVMHQSESRTMEYKTGGGRYPLTVLREVCALV